MPESKSTQTATVETAPAPEAAPAEDKIAFYGEEPEAPVEEPTEETPAAEGEEVPQPEGTATAATAEGKTPAAPEAAKPAETPPSPPVPTQAEIQALAQLLQRQQQQIQAFQQAQEAAAAAEAQRQLRVALEGQGYTEDQVQAALKQHADLAAEKKQLADQRQAMAQYIQTQRHEDQAKIQVAQLISQKFGMPFADLMKLDTPQMMEAKAEAWQAKQELAKVQQAAVKPSKVASVGPGQQPATSRTRLLDLYNRGEDLTPEQEKVLFGSR